MTSPVVSDEAVEAAEYMGKRSLALRACKDSLKQNEKRIDNLQRERTSLLARYAELEKRLDNDISRLETEKLREPVPKPDPIEAP